MKSSACPHTPATELLKVLELELVFLDEWLRVSAVPDSVKSQMLNREWSIQRAIRAARGEQ